MDAGSDGFVVHGKPNVCVHMTKLFGWLTDGAVWNEARRENEIDTAGSRAKRTKSTSDDQT